MILYKYVIGGFTGLPYDVFFCAHVHTTGRQLIGQWYVIYVAQAVSGTKKKIVSLNQKKTVIEYDYDI